MCDLIHRLDNLWCDKILKGYSSVKAKQNPGIVKVDFVSKLVKILKLYVCDSELTHLSIYVEKEGGQLCGPEGKGDVRQQLTSHCSEIEGCHSFSHKSHSCCNL